MANLNNLKRIVKEDFAEEDQELVDKLSFALNPFLEQVSNAFNKNITIENLSRELITFTVECVSGIPKIQTQFKSNLRSQVKGFNIIKAENVTNTATYPTEAPWISWTISENLITVKKVTGIQDNNKYRFTLEVIS